MIKASWMAPLAISMLWTATGFADDVQSSNTDDEPLPVVVLSVATMLAESAYPYRWQPFHPAEVTAYSDNRLLPIADFDFQDAGAFSRFSKLRSLSLLTVAQFGETRLFLGVNEEGLVGLHFDAFPHQGGERYLEVVRMPYLKKPARQRSRALRTGGERLLPTPDQMNASRPGNYSSEVRYGSRPCEISTTDSLRNSPQTQHETPTANRPAIAPC